MKPRVWITALAIGGPPSSAFIQTKVRIEPRPVTATVTATAANYGELWRTSADDRLLTHVQGERPRTLANGGGLKNTVLKTTKVQAFGGSNPSPSAFGHALVRSAVLRQEGVGRWTAGPSGRPEGH
jgi:hypothetical protein